MGVFILKDKKTMRLTCNNCDNHIDISGDDISGDDLNFPIEYVEKNGWKIIDSKSSNPKNYCSKCKKTGKLRRIK